MDVRDTIYNLYAKKIPVTLKSLKDVLKERGVLDIGRNSLSKLVENLGFRYRKDCNWRYLCEKPEIASQRLQF